MKNIIYIGQFRDVSGYGNAARSYLRLLDKYLDKSEYNLCIIPLGFERQNNNINLEKTLIEKYNLTNIKNFISTNEYQVFFHLLPTMHSIDVEMAPLKTILTHKNCLKKTNFVAWETDKIPESWIKIYKENIFDDLVVFCDWNKQVFEKYSKLNITVVPHPVYDIYESEIKEKNEKFNIFSMSQWTNRKGFDILLRSYYQEFFLQDDVELFIKTYRNEVMPGIDERIEKEAIIEDVLKIKNRISHYGQQPKCKVSIKTGTVSSQQIKEYYQKADVFCLPTRGEGFGMTIAQAALSGIPCIVPDIGGHLDYLDLINTFLIKSEMTPVYDMPHQIYSSIDMNFIEPSIQSTMKQLRKSYQLWKEDSLLDIALKNKKNAKEYLSEKTIFEKLKNIL